MERNRRDGASAPKRIVLLGATGSIGKSCASVILANPRKFQVEAVVGGRAASIPCPTRRRSPPAPANLAPNSPPSPIPPATPI